MGEVISLTTYKQKKMATKKSTSPRKTRSSSKTDSKCEVSFIGGKYEGKTLCIAYPSPKFLVLSMGTELYERQDPDNILDATYRYTDNWDAYEKHRKEQGIYVK